MADDNMTTTEVNAAEVPFASSGIEAPTYFVDDIRGAGVINGVVRLNLVENRVEAGTNKFSSKIVAVLAVPLEMLRNWGPFLTRHFPPEVTEQEPPKSDG
ncbi:MAG: hypothetical protein ACTHJK_01295 [Sphingomicrobium sp.]